MSYQDLILEHRGAVSWVYFNRPKALNAISVSAMGQFRDCLAELRDRAETRVIVFSGKGRAFCAGADLSEGGMPQDASPEPSFLDVALQMEAVLNSISKPVLAAVNGVCCGGGLELALMCDVIIAAESAKIGDAHANFGVMPGGGATVHLPRLVGPNWARLLMFTGDLHPAPKMAEIGLVQILSKDEELEADVQALAEKMASKSPLGLGRMKRLIADGFNAATPQAIAAEKALSQLHMRSYDAREGGKAFAEKRKPEFRGY